MRPEEGEKLKLPVRNAIPGLSAASDSTGLFRCFLPGQAFFPENPPITGLTLFFLRRKCYNEMEFVLIDTPGTYSIMSNSEEEEIARNYICFGNPDSTIVVVDATCLERNLNLVFQIMEITDNVIVCVNLLDEAKKKGININLLELEKILGVPVVGTIARKKKTLNRLMDTIRKVSMGEIIPKPRTIRYLPYIEQCVETMREKIEKMLLQENKRLARWIALKVIDGDSKIIENIEENLEIKITNSNELEREYLVVEDILSNNGIKRDKVKNELISSIIFKAENVCNDIIKIENSKYSLRDKRIDKIITSKKFGIPIMILFLGIIFWITITGANYPSQWISNFFEWLQIKIENLFTIFQAPQWLKGALIDGVYKTLTWIIAVMLPPMAIFFPMFTLLEDLGFLPRIAFNLDKFFRKVGSSR